jgi:cysteine synthase A
MRAESILSTIGNTPHVRIRSLFGTNHSVWIKLERANPAGSIKDRIALAMVEAAERSGELKAGGVIIEPSSGNTGVALAMVGAVKGYRVIVVMPESMSIERRKLIRLYGGELVLTPREKGMRGAVERATELLNEIPNGWIPQQFKNPANPAIHAETTAREIIADFPEGIDYLITGVGTGGHITACAKILKERFPKLKVFAVEPAASPVISGGSPAPHPIQGIGAGFIPDNLDRSLLDGVVQIPNEAAFDYARRAAKQEGICLGVSSGASLAAVAQKLDQIPAGATILTFCYDTGERYFSVANLYSEDVGG